MELARELAHAPASADMREERLKSGVYRLRCTFDGRTRSFVGKRLDPDIARRNELVARRWLPAAGLADSGPPLLATLAERDGSSVWHLYEDLGDCGLDVAEADLGLVSLAVATIARIHTRFAQHPLVPEFRVWGGDLGIYFYAASVRDAITSLEAVLSQEQPLDPARRSLCSRLVARLSGLSDEREARAETLARHGGPETLLHGDLWPMNVMVHAGPGSVQVRLIDWDHAAVGPVSYDLSTFLHRFPIRDRMQVLQLYEAAVADAGWRLPPVTDLNLIFETAELGRIANRVIWPALAASENGADWAYAELEEVERWFEQLEPILPLGDACAQS
jgi:thiamine kinase-like enzyme